jgi:hypothetical protein
MVDSQATKCRLDRRAHPAGARWEKRFCMDPTTVPGAGGIVMTPRGSGRYMAPVG